MLDELEAGGAELPVRLPRRGHRRGEGDSGGPQLYGAAGVNFAAKARKQLAQIAADGFAHLPVCVAKTQYSFTTDPKAVGAPSGHTIDVREVRLSAGAGFIVLVTGDIMTMPGLPKVPASSHIDIDDHGVVTGLS